MYVELFQDMLCTVLASESHLFTPAEQAVLTQFLLLGYDARYLFVRLLQRKRDQWYRLDKLEYRDDVDDLAGAAHELCRTFAAPADKADGADDPLELNRFAMMDVEMDGGMERRLGLVTVDELRALARRLGRRPQGARAELVQRLLAPPQNATLFAQGRELGVRYDTSLERLEAELAALMHGGCVRLLPGVVDVMERLALVYYRGRPALGSMLTSAVLHRTQRCHFPTYVCARTPTLFPSRAVLLRFEAAARAAEQMDELVGELRSRAGAAADGAQLLEACWAPWLESVGELRAAYADGVPRAVVPTLRFHPGWPLARVLFKACECLARLGRVDQERDVLLQLLAQRYVWSGRRGAWYDRLALLTARSRTKAEAVVVCREALRDRDTHTVYVPMLERRIARLEQQLKRPAAERYRPGVALRAPRTVTLHGVRLPGRGVVPRAPRQMVLAADLSLPRSVGVATPAVGQRTVWRGASGDECTVEEFCLEHYAVQGFRGYHCEGGLLYFVFTLLLWDVLFQPLPGAFETPYQRGPLDLGTDVFVPARQEAVDAVLAHIAATGGLDLLDRTDARERVHGTYAVGCRWDEFPAADVREFAECVGGPALAALCRLLCEEYQMRSGGFPDLSVWRYQDRQVRFVEVKSPSDRLSENQRVWIDALLRAGLTVELARVEVGGATS